MPKPKNLPFQEISNTVNHADKGDRATKSRKGPVSRIPRRCANKNKHTTTSPSNNSDKNDAKDNDDHRSPSLEKSVNLNDVPACKETIPTTPAGCIAARIRSYSALCRSQRRKKKSKDCSSDSNKENTLCSPAKTMSPVEETGHDPMSTEVENNSDLSSENESDEDILWKMTRRHCSEMEDMAHTKVSKIGNSKNKYCQDG